MVKNLSPYENNLLESLKFGYLDKNSYRSSGYEPKLLWNDQSEGRYVLDAIQNEFDTCQSFAISVAFITLAGIAMLKTQLSDLADRGISGRIIISPYLGFNHPDAMRELLKFKNIEVRLTPDQKNMHAKCYLFSHQDEKVMILGSSNLTHSALKINYEWNVRLSSSVNGDLIHQTEKEFDRLWQQSKVLNEEVIDSYSRYHYTPMEKIKIDLIEEKDPFTDKKRGLLKPNTMQKEALASIQAMRDQGADKSLVISATGTGKTYLAALDIEQFKPERCLFIVHREQILHKAKESFKDVLFFQEEEACLYRSGMDLEDKKYVFATVQTLSQDKNLLEFAPDFFDYILIDEVHRAGAASHLKVINHFQPHFLLGITATPERTDGFNIFELFDYNIAYEIRLHQALEEDMLCPFMYYGVKDMAVDGQLVEDTTRFTDLVDDSRVHHIMEKAEFYSVSGQKRRGLIFCSRKEEAHTLSTKLNQKGYRTQALTGDDSQDYRFQIVEELEAGRLDYILTVDIFNEGVDIPSVNQIIMLRNTQSSIVFVQQLGRGLRKHPSKEFLTVIDFIGNYRNNYLIPIALFGDQSMSKDNYRRHLITRNQIQGLTTVNFEAVAREQIFQSITSTNLANMKILREKYTELKQRLGRIPQLSDYLKQDQLDPLVFFENKSFKHYGQVITKFEKELDLSFNKKADQFLYFISYELLNGKRSHELLLLKELVQNQSFLKNDFKALLTEMNLVTDQETLDSVFGVVSLAFFKNADRKKYGYPLIEKDPQRYYLSDEWFQALNTEPARSLILDALETGLLRYQQYQTSSVALAQPMKVGQKYSRKDAVRLLAWDKDESSTVYGYRVKHSSCPIFVTYHKADDISETTQYLDRFINEGIFHWYTRSNRTFASGEVKDIIHSNEKGIALHLFVKKEDGEGSDFYYLGPVHYVKESAEEQTMANGTPVVTMDLSLDHPVPPQLYQYFKDR